MKPKTPSAPDAQPERDGVIFTSAASIKPKAVRWAWHGRVPLGMLTLVVGNPGQGKSTFLIKLAACLSRGQLDGDLAGEPVHVGIATTEDAIEQVVVPRLIAADADLARVHVIEVARQ